MDKSGVQTMTISPKRAALLNSMALIFIGMASYINSSSWTPLIPVSIGILILVCFVFYEKKPKLFAHLSVSLMILAFFGFFKPLMGAFSDSDLSAVARVLSMQIITTYSIICFVLSFIRARKTK